MKFLDVRFKGFTLIELAIVLFIISLLLVGLLGPVASQIESRERQYTEDLMADIIESLYGYAIVNGFLPCPDGDDDGLIDGLADPNGDECDDDEGWLPWVTLDINIQGDAWGNLFRYRVTEDFTNSDDGICDDDDDLDLCEIGNIRILTRGNNPSTGPIESKFEYEAADVVPAILVSHGKNELGATTIHGVALTATTAGTDEDENSDDDIVFYSRIYSEGASGCADDTNEANLLCEFDDIVKWISPNILMNRLVKAGLLP
jgi:prepilin-type N-terminal cleavage/methylation domain-containing protein